MKTMQKGFTLIELMIVIAIIAILAAIALPQYQNYVTKSQFAESNTVADGLKTPVLEYFNQTANCPSNSTTGFSNANSYSGKYVTSATLAGTNSTGPCTITVAFKAAGSVSAPLAGQSVVFTGTNNGGTVSWTCVASAIGPQYKPVVCQ